MHATSARVAVHRRDAAKRVENRKISGDLTYLRGVSPSNFDPPRNPSRSVLSCASLGSPADPRPRALSCPPSIMHCANYLYGCCCSGTCYLQDSDKCMCVCLRVCRGATEGTDGLCAAHSVCVCMLRGVCDASERASRVACWSAQTEKGLFRYCSWAVASARDTA